MHNLAQLSLSDAPAYGTWIFGLLITIGILNLVSGTAVNWKNIKKHPSIDEENARALATALIVAQNLVTQQLETVRTDSARNMELLKNDTDRRIDKFEKYLHDFRHDVSGEMQATRLNIQELIGAVGSLEGKISK